MVKIVFSLLTELVARILACALSVTLVANFCADVRADEVRAFQEYEKMLRDSPTLSSVGKDIFGDRIDYSTGSAGFYVNDVSIPGNNELPVVVNRTMSLTENRSGATSGDLADWSVDIPRLEGVFARDAPWQIDDASNPNRRCAVSSVEQAMPPSVAGVPASARFESHEYWSGVTLMGINGGAEALLLLDSNSARPTDGKEYYWVTKSGWMFSCIDGLKNGGEGQGFLARSPSGLVYRFDYWVSRYYDSFVRVGAPLPRGDDQIDVPPLGRHVLPRVRVELRVSRIEDRFGNSVTYEYDGDRLNEIRSDFEINRKVSFHYDASTGKLDYVTDGSRYWRYYYGADHRLEYVLLPDGSRWAYSLVGNLALNYSAELGGASDICSATPVDSKAVYSVNSPMGGKAEFVLHPVDTYRFTYRCQSEGAPRYIWNMGIRSKVVTGTQLTSTTTSFSRVPAPRVDDSTVCEVGGTCPTTRSVDVSESNGNFVRYTYGAREGVDEGLLLKQEEGRSVGGAYSASGVKRTTSYAYQSPASPIGFVARAGRTPYTYGDWFMTENHIPLVRRDIVQDGVTFTWRATAFDAFVNPTAITRSSSLGWSKSETRAYRHFTNHWLMSQPQNVIDVASGAVEDAWFYWSTTGQLSSHRQFGVPDGTRSYNTDGTLATHVLPEGNTLQYSDWYRGVPRLVTNSADGTSSSAVVSPVGKITSITDETGATTGFEYDVMGRIKKITPPTGDSTTWSNTEYVYEQLNTANYGISGSYWRSTETTGTSKRETYYDALWRPILVRAYDTGAPSLARFVRYGYDAVGNRNFESYPGFVSSQANYVTALSSGVTTSYDALSRVTAQTSSSELGTLTSTTDYLGNFVVRTRNPRGYETEQVFMAYDDPAQAWPVSLTQAKGHSEQIDTTIARDVWGKPTAITRSGWYRDFTPAEYQSLTRRFVYDSNQRLCKQYDPESGWRVIDYTSSNAIYWVADGQSLTSTTDCQRTSVPSSAKVIRSYNLRGMLTGIAYPDSTDDAAFTYWPDGALYTATVGTGASAKAWTYQYNKRRLLSAETLSLDGRSFSLSYRFNGLGQVSQVQYPDAEWVSYSPNVFGEPTQAGSVASGASYSRFGGLTGFTYGNGLLYDATENQRGLIETQRWRNGSVPLLHYGYTYDAHGNLQTQDDYVGSTAEYHNEGRSLGYDGLDRMTVANSSPQPPLRAPTPWAYSWGDGRMTYDVMDNLRSYALAAIDFRYEHDANNRPRRIIFAGSTFRNYGYNARGQMTYRDHDTGGQTLSWDSADRLLGISGVGGSEQYAYDAHGHRVRSSKAGETRYQMYSRAGQLMYDESTSGERRKYYYLGSRLVGQTEGVSSQMRYLLTDRQGSVRAKTDANRVISYETVRGPYGSVLLGWAYQNGPALAGHMEDAISGLTYMEARYYDPVAMRFISPDPVGVSGSNGGNFNRYWYANNNPYTFVDPDGAEPYRFAASGWLARVISGAPSENANRRIFQEQVVESFEREVDYQVNTAPEQAMRTGSLVLTALALSPVGDVAVAGLGLRTATKSLPGVAQEIGILRSALSGKGNFGLGTATREQAERLGRAWVGAGATAASDGKTLVSADGFRQYRPPSLKPRLGIEQANFESRGEPPLGSRIVRRWQNNGHLNIKEEQK